jgi:hypothetical protein
VTAIRGPAAAEAIYGTIVALAVVVGVSTDPEAGAGYVLGGVLVTAFVFFAAHLYADVLAARMAEGGARWRDLVRSSAAEEWPFVEAALVPAVPLVLGAAGVLSRDTAVLAAIVVGVAELFACGMAVGRVLGRRPLLMFVSGLLNAGLGMLMILLKAVLHH